ncbi:MULTISPECIES: gpW family head-tail joining protein [Sphingomonas]|uniref:gpW family head-tail joining protein n=1 Tax=Sphingomonas TaxID=13687 RepID=UPI00082FBBB7|nr:gpW family head-tail joining protein [Sphingomonas sp. CCH10-B3]
MSIFAGMSPDQLQAALTAAQAALIELQSGKAMASLSYTQGDGAKSVTRRVTTVAEATALIMQLQQALGLRGPRHTRRLVYL